MVHTVTDSTFNNIINENDVVVLDVWAEWCGPCKMIGPIVEDLSEEYDSVYVGKIDADMNHEVMVKYGIRNIPTILFFKKGELKDKQVGLVPKHMLVEKIETL